MRWFIVYLFFLSFIVSGCTGLNSRTTSPPPDRQIVSVGDKNSPDHNDYILFVKSGQAIPMSIKIKGTMFTNSSSLQSHIVASRDIYLYKHRASFNGRDWYPLNRLLSIRLSARMSAKGGGFEIQVDKRHKTRGQQ